MFSRIAVSSSPMFIIAPMSPDAQRTGRSGRASLAPSAIGNEPPTAAQSSMHMKVPGS